MPAPLPAIICGRERKGLCRLDARRVTAEPAVGPVSTGLVTVGVGGCFVGALAEREPVELGTGREPHALCPAGAARLGGRETTGRAPAQASMSGIRPLSRRLMASFR